MEVELVVAAKKEREKTFCFYAMPLPPHFDRVINKTVRMEQTEKYFWKRYGANNNNRFNISSFRILYPLVFISLFPIRLSLNKIIDRQVINFGKIKTVS